MPRRTDEEILRFSRSQLIGGDADFDFIAVVFFIVDTKTIRQSQRTHALNISNLNMCLRFTGLGFNFDNVTIHQTKPCRVIWVDIETPGLATLIPSRVANNDI